MTLDILEKLSGKWYPQSRAFVNSLPDVLKRLPDLLWFDEVVVFGLRLGNPPLHSPIRPFGIIG